MCIINVNEDNNVWLLILMDVLMCVLLVMW